MSAYKEMMDFASKLQLCGHSALAFTIRKFGSLVLDEQEKFEKEEVRLAMIVGNMTKEIFELNNDLTARTQQLEFSRKLISKPLKRLDKREVAHFMFSQRTGQDIGQALIKYFCDKNGLELDDIE